MSKYYDHYLASPGSRPHPKPASHPLVNPNYHSLLYTRSPPTGRRRGAMRPRPRTTTPTTRPTCQSRFTITTCMSSQTPKPGSMLNAPCWWRHNHCLATWGGSLARLLAALAHSGHAAETRGPDEVTRTLRWTTPRSGSSQGCNPMYPSCNPTLSGPKQVPWREWLVWTRGQHRRPSFKWHEGAVRAECETRARRF